MYNRFATYLLEIVSMQSRGRWGKVDNLSKEITLQCFNFRLIFINGTLVMDMFSLKSRNKDETEVNFI